MTVLSSLFDKKTNNPCDISTFFNKAEFNILRTYEKRELPPIGKPEAS